MLHNHHLLEAQDPRTGDIISLPSHEHIQYSHSLTIVNDALTYNLLYLKNNIIASLKKVKSNNTIRGARSLDTQIIEIVEKKKFVNTFFNMAQTNVFMVSFNLTEYCKAFISPIT